MRRAYREAQPAAFGIGAGFVGKLTFEHEQLGALLIGEGAEIRLWRPSFKTNDIREAVLLVERFVADGSILTGLPVELTGVDDHVAPFLPRKLPQLHEQDAAGFRKRGMAKTFGIEEKRARGPVPVLVREDAFEHQDLFAVRMIMRRKARIRLVAHDRSNLA